MPARNTASTCAGILLAMVFSVQQGEHGPLVVYKLQLPKTATAPAVASAPPATMTLHPPASTTPAQPRLSPLKPGVLGTVVMPRGWRPAPVPSAPIPLLPPERPEGDPAPGDRAAADLPGAESTIPPAQPKPLTLNEVTEAVEWRRDTLEKLPEAPFAPRF